MGSFAATDSLRSSDGYSRGPSGDLSQARCNPRCQDWPKLLALGACPYLVTSVAPRCNVWSALSCDALTPHVMLLQPPMCCCSAGDAGTSRNPGSGSSGGAQQQQSGVTGQTTNPGQCTPAPPPLRGCARALCQGCGQVATLQHAAVSVAHHQVLLGCPCLLPRVFCAYCLPPGSAKVSWAHHQPRGM